MPLFKERPVIADADLAVTEFDRPSDVIYRHTLGMIA